MVAQGQKTHNLEQVEQAFIDYCKNYNKPMTNNQKKSFFKWAKKYLQKHTFLHKDIKFAIIQYFLYSRGFLQFSPEKNTLERDKVFYENDRVTSNKSSKKKRERTYHPNYYNELFWDDLPDNVPRNTLPIKNNAIIKCLDCDKTINWYSDERVLWYIDDKRRLYYCPVCKQKFG